MAILAITRSECEKKIIHFSSSRFSFILNSISTDFHYSELTILHTTKNHSGNYTCVPSNSQPASVVVHIFKGLL